MMQLLEVHALWLLGSVESDSFYIFLLEGGLRMGDQANCASVA